MPTSSAGKDTRAISWIKAAHKEFGKFPHGAKTIILRALTIAAEGSKADIAKPMKGLGPGVIEIALAYRSDAYRTVYAVTLGEDIWGCPRIPEEVHQGHQNTEKRNRLDPFAD